MSESVIADRSTRPHGRMHGRLHRNDFPREFAFDRQIGRKVKLAREKRGWSQAVLAEKIGITSEQVSLYETATHRMTASRLVTISQILRFPPWYFMEDLA